MDPSTSKGTTIKVRPILFLVLAAVPLAVALALPQREVVDPPYKKLAGTYEAKAKPRVDHSQFPQLQKPFAKAQDVTRACISCHNQRHKEVMASSHWNWSRKEYVKGRGIIEIGKSNVLNNFCVGVSGNRQSCGKCHIGYGAGTKEFDAKNPVNIDCLACHDNSGDYIKGNAMAGLPDPKVNLQQVAVKVGRPNRTSCGSCHFYGGGGNNVKHGDLEESLISPDKTVDVHMAPSASNLQCVDCHQAAQHQMLGKVYSIATTNTGRVECSSCHGEFPHNDDVVNRHMEKVACQSCHIPTYAKVNPTKLTWDWSTAGRLKDGKPYEEEGPLGQHAYMSIKGTFTWGKDLKPDYVWFNGTARHYLVGDRFDPSKTLEINHLNGSYDDPDAKIYPVKFHRAKQPYDPTYKILIQPKTYSAHKGDGGYWGDFNWTKAAELGMKEIGQPFSGKVAFANTVMVWPINHMVSSKDKAVQCQECHTRDKGRLEKVKGFYLPGRDLNQSLDFLGLAAVIASLLGAAIHGGLRIASAFRSGEK